MSGVILRGQALKVVNKGGGFTTRTVKDEVEDPITGKKTKVHKHQVSRSKLPGSDYIVFNCPACGQRNKRCAYEVKGRAGNALSFKCNKCYREIEVAPPLKPNTIIMGTEPAARASSSLVGPDGRPL
jgi:hypothetical protein